jgi:hypothetical protein
MGCREAPRLRRRQRVVADLGIEGRRARDPQWRDTRCDGRQEHDAKDAAQGGDDDKQ